MSPKFSKLAKGGAELNCNMISNCNLKNDRSQIIRRQTKWAHQRLGTAVQRKEEFDPLVRETDNPHREFIDATAPAAVSRLLSPPLS